MEDLTFDHIGDLLKFYYGADDEEKRASYTRLVALKEEDPGAFIISLINHLGDQNNQLLTRKIAAVFLYKEIVPDDAQGQRVLADLWSKFEPQIHEDLCIASTNGIFEGDTDLTQQTSQLLGLFYTFEFSRSEYTDNFLEFIDIAANSHNESEQGAVLLTIKYFLEKATELYFPKGLSSQLTSFKNVAQPIFDLFVSILQSPEFGRSIEIITTALRDSLIFFYKPISMPQNCETLVSLLIDLIQNDDFFKVAYEILAKFVEHFYAFIYPYIENILVTVSEHLNSENADAIEYSCLFIQAIAHVEHRMLISGERISNPTFSEGLFEMAFEPLITTIASTDPEDIEISYGIDSSPQRSAFCCFLELAVATGEQALEPILEVVQENHTNEDWRLRLASALLLHCATKVESFSQILPAFEIFIELMSDEVPVVQDKAMWLLGLLICDVPDLVMDSERFVALINIISEIIPKSQELLLRGMWLLEQIFHLFSPEEDDTLLAEAFDELAPMILNAADLFGEESVVCAYGTLNRLIENAPINLPESYANLLSEVMRRLENVTAGGISGEREQHQASWLVTTVQALVMNMASIEGVEIEQPDKLIEMLTAMLHMANGFFVGEVLPAIGAVIRLVGSDFSPYISDLLQFVVDLAQHEEHVQPVAIFLDDLYHTLGSLDQETNEIVVARLFEDFEFENLTDDSLSALFSVFGDIAVATVPWCFEWMDRLLEIAEDRQRVPSSDGSVFQGIVHCFQCLVSVFAEAEGGDRKVRSFFSVFDRILALATAGDLDPNIMYEAVVLLGLIAETFGRPLNVHLNKQSIRRLLNLAKNSNNDYLIEKAEEVQAIIRQC